MRNHEHLHTQPNLTVEGEVYDELEQDRELDRLANELEAGSRKSEIAKKDIGEAEYATGKLNPWERMAASLPGFNRERAEHARQLAERDKAQKERLKTVETVLEEGTIEGRENELIRALGDLKWGVTNEKSIGYNRYFERKVAGQNPEERFWKKKGGAWANSDLYKAESKEIRAVQGISENKRKSLDRLVAFKQEQEKKQEQERQLRKEEERRREREEREKLNEERRREREAEASSHGFESEIAKIRGVENGRMHSPESAKERHIDATPNKQVTPETPKPVAKESEEYQGYQETTELPDQGSDLVDPFSMMSA